MVDVSEDNGQPEDMEDLNRSYPKADVVHRFIAKFIDFLIAAGMAQFIPPVGYLAGLTYLMIADGLSNGQSFGKKVISLQTMVPEEHLPASYRESILRNIPCAAAYLCYLIPFFGWILGIGIIVVEALLIVGNRTGLRLGDEIAHTRVIEGIATTEVLKPGEPVKA